MSIPLTPRVPTDLPVGTTVRVVHYGYGARLSDVGAKGEVVRHNRTRVVVRFAVGWGFSEDRASAPACLRAV